MIRVIVVDDQDLVRAGLAALLDRATDITVVAQEPDGDRALASVRAHRPDVVLMDIRMPGLDGIEATRRMAADPELRDVRVVMLTTFDTDEYVLDAVHAGASGFLLKSTTPDGLRDAVRTVAGGEAMLAPAVTRTVLRALADGGQRTSPEPLECLTEREIGVLTLVGRGLSNAEIAAELHLSPATTRTYVSRLLTKLDARDRAQLVVTAFRTGLVRPGEG